ncbi:MAG: DNA-directed RNA polymerase subunit delta [Mycoplasmataceae bacterium]|nr:DNA-directed RNA polymerase subunit delta [Mycoplasmataceae bacterium]
MARQQFIDQIYHLVKNEYDNKTFTFEEVWKKIIKESKLSKEEQKQNIGIVYTDLLQDARFVYTGNKKWMLREFATQEEIAQYQNALYDFNTDIAEEGYIPSVTQATTKDEEEEVEDKGPSEEEEEDMDVKSSLEKTVIDEDEE